MHTDYMMCHNNGVCFISFYFPEKPMRSDLSDTCFKASPAERAVFAVEHRQAISSVKCIRCSWYALMIPLMIHCRIMKIFDLIFSYRVYLRLKVRPSNIFFSRFWCHLKLSTPAVMQINWTARQITKYTWEWPLIQQPSKTAITLLVKLSL